MGNFPQLKVKGLGRSGSEDIRDFEQARHLPFGHGIMIVVEGQVVRSYEALVHFASKDNYKDKEFLEVKILPLLGGG